MINFKIRHENFGQSKIIFCRNQLSEEYLEDLLEVATLFYNHACMSSEIAVTLQFKEKNVKSPFYMVVMAS